MNPISASAEETMERALRNVPSLSVIVMELLHSLDGDNANAALLAKRLGQDPPLSARVLRVVNSPFYGMSGRISSLPEAVLVLGFSNVRSLALAASLLLLGGTEDSAEGSGVDLWKHSFCSAVSARLLARLFQVNAEKAFTTGLLLDIGRIAMLSLDVERLAKVSALARDEGVAHWQAERHVLGFDHAELGARLLKQWRLPADLCQAVGRHHMAADSDCLNNLGRVAHASADAYDYQHATTARNDGVIGAALLRSGISLRECQEALQPLGDQVQVMSAMLSGE